MRRQLARESGKSSCGGDLAGIEDHVTRVIQNELGLHGAVYKPDGLVTGMCAAISGGTDLVATAAREGMLEQPGGVVL